MPVEVILPKVDMDMATGRISRWFVAEGAAVKKGELLFEIETDKAAMEIDAPASGTLRNVVAGENVDIPVGQAVAWIYAEGEAESVPASSPDASEAAESFTSSLRGGGAEGAGGGNSIPADHPPTPALRTDPPHKGEGKPSGTLRATPLARRIARESGVVLEQVEGSGPKGRVTRKDVEAATSMISIAPLWGGRAEGAGGGHESSREIAFTPTRRYAPTLPTRGRVTPTLTLSGSAPAARALPSSCCTASVPI